MRKKYRADLVHRLAPALLIRLRVVGYLDRDIALMNPTKSCTGEISILRDFPEQK